VNNTNNWDETVRIFIQVYLYLCKYLSNLVPVILLVHTTYEDGTECSETSEHKIQTPENHPGEGEDSIMLSFPRKGRVKDWIKVALSWGTCSSLLPISSIFTDISQRFSSFFLCLSFRAS
jgi:hypothetical protein